MNNSKNTRTIILTVVITVLIMFGVCTGAEEDENPLLRLTGLESSSQAELVWVEHAGNLYDLYYSVYMNEEWQAKQTIVEGELLMVTPSIVMDNNGRILVVWSQKSEKSTDLYYSVLHNSSWSSPVKIETNLTSNLSPALAVDKDNQLWLAWVGFDGVDDDIYFSRWDGVDWDLPERVNIDNVTPDLFPVVGIGSNGFPWIQWSGYEDGKYKQLRSSWNGVSWEERREMKDKAVTLDGYNLELAEETNGSASSPAQGINTSQPSIVLPVYLEEPKRAMIHIRNGGKGIQALPLRDFFAD